MSEHVHMPLENVADQFCSPFFTFFVKVDDYTVQSPVDLGPLILVRLEKKKYWVEDNWFCRYVKVSVPGERLSYTFPCYRWLVGDGVVVELREGAGQLCNIWKVSFSCVCNKLILPLLFSSLSQPKSWVMTPCQRSYHTERLSFRRGRRYIGLLDYIHCIPIFVKNFWSIRVHMSPLRWLAWAPGIPKCIDSKTEADLPQDVRFDNEKRSDFVGSLHYAWVKMQYLSYTKT